METLTGEEILVSTILEFVEEIYGFYFNESNAEYVVKETGLPISNETTGQMSFDYGDVIKHDLGSLTDDFINEKITLQQWQDRSANEIKDLWIAQAIFGRGGRASMTQEDWGRTGGRLRYEYAKLDNFAREIEAGNLSPAQIKARVQLYAAAGKVAYNDGLTAAKKEAGFTEEARFLNPAEHCSDCVEYAAMGWVPIGSLPEPGEASQCGRNCKCYKEYRKTVDVQEMFDQYENYWDDEYAASLAFENNYMGWVHDLSYDEREAIEAYTNGYYTEMNRYLRTGIVPSGYGNSERIEMVSRIATLNNALLDAPMLDTSTILYRGSKSEELINSIVDGSLKVGDIMIDKGFMSASPLEKVASGFAGGRENRYKMIIMADAGTSPGAWIGDEDLTGYTDEVEFLFLPGTKLEIMQIEHTSELSITDIWLKIVEGE